MSRSSVDRYDPWVHVLPDYHQEHVDLVPCKKYNLVNPRGPCTETVFVSPGGRCFKDISPPPESRIVMSRRTLSEVSRAAGRDIFTRLHHVPPPELAEPLAGDALEPVNTPADSAARRRECENKPSEPPGDLTEKGGTNSRVADKLREKPRATSIEIAKAIKISPQRVRTTPAWKSNREQLKKQDQQRSVRTRPLTDAMLAVTDARSGDPFEIAAEREEQAIQELSHRDDPVGAEPIEILERRFLEAADADLRARFHRLTPEDKKHELQAWWLTGQHLAD